MRRTFIAIKIEPGDRLLQAYTKLQNELKNEKIKWVDDENFHTTLFFLGDTSEEMISRVKQALAGLTPAFEAFDINLYGMGVFKNLKKPRVLWAGIREFEPLEKIKQAVDQKMSQLGYTPDEREFRPHLTLARIKWIEDKNKLEHLLLEYEQQQWQKTRISELIYYESKLQRSGPVYTPIEKFPLE
jgi:2'-5' RNA ligase